MAEEQYKSLNRGAVQRAGATETKLLLLKSMLRDRIQVRQKQAMQRWIAMVSTERQRSDVNKVMRQMLVVQKLIARKELH